MKFRLNYELRIMNLQKVSRVLQYLLLTSVKDEYFLISSYMFEKLFISIKYFIVLTFFGCFFIDTKKAHGNEYIQLTFLPTNKYLFLFIN